MNGQRSLENGVPETRPGPLWTTEGTKSSQQKGLVQEGGGHGRGVERRPRGQGQEDAPVGPGGLPGGGVPSGRQEVTVGKKLRKPAVDVQRRWV